MIMKKILVKKGVSRELAKMFGVTHRAVCYALTYVSQSPTAEKIRETALQKGGQVYEIHLAEPETTKKPVKVLDKKGNVVRTINA